MVSASSAMDQNQLRLWSGLLALCRDTKPRTDKSSTLERERIIGMISSIEKLYQSRSTRGREVEASALALIHSIGTVFKPETVQVLIR